MTISAAPGRHAPAAARIALGFALCSCWGCDRDATPLYKDPSASIEARAGDLLRRMTPEEKFWQLFMVAADLEQGAERYPLGAFGLQARPIPEQSDSSGNPARALAERINAAQRFFTTRTRLGIPIVPFEEALHGLVQPGATAFPQAIALAATWDTALMGSVAAAIARETRSRGIRLALSPVLNIASDVRWGRTEETYGEDPYLVSTMGLAFVRAFETAGVVSTPKHFVANVGEGGRDSYPIDWSARHLEEVHFPPFRAAVEAGAGAVMAAYNSVDGSPASASRWLLTRTLKGSWGFPGVVIADAGGTGGANVLHGTSPDYATSGQRALEAGLDVLFQTSADHSPLFLPAFREGRIDPRVIDGAVARVLRLKLRLGLFENPFVDPEAAARAADSGAHRALALDAARASIVLLKNDRDVLPLRRPVRSVAVIGADAAEGRLGGYSRPGSARVPILEGIRAKLGTAGTVRYEPGVSRTSEVHTVVPAANLFHDSAGVRAPGLRGEYFDNPRLDGRSVLTRIDPSIDFTWTLGGPDSSLASDWYSVRWTGKLTAPVAGPLRLGVEGPDGYRLYLDGRLLIDNWRKQTAGIRLEPVRLERGRAYDFRLEYFESTGGARLRLVWDQPAGREWSGAIRRAAALAGASDAAIVVAGIEEGEFRDRASLRLPGHQEALIRAVAATGRPVIVVLVGGSAVTMSEWIGHVSGVVMAWYPGDEGGHAVADVLFGDVNPAGRLPISFPLSEGQLPLVYNHKPTGRGDDYLDATGRPLFPFGFGLSYARFEYRDLVIGPEAPSAGDSVIVRCRVRNTGRVAGDEVVQLYLRDEVASVTRPVMMLAGFARVRIPAGEERQVTFVVRPDQLSLLDEQLQRRVEPGRFRVMVGASSADIRLRGHVTVRE